MRFFCSLFMNNQQNSSQYKLTTPNIIFSHIYSLYFYLILNNKMYVSQLFQSSKQRIFYYISKMEKVPEIRLFNTGESFRKSTSPSYAKQFKYSSAINTNLQYKAYTHINTNTPRSNSVNQKFSNNKPFQTNYYQTALRICQDNRVLNKNHFNTQSYGFLKPPTYLQFNGHSNCCKNECFSNENKTCLKAHHQKPQTDIIKKSASSQFSFKNNTPSKNDFNINHELDVYRKQNIASKTINNNQTSYQNINYFNSQQNTPRSAVQKYKTSRKSITDYIQQGPQIKNTISTSQIQPLTINKSRAVPVSFNQITNSYIVAETEKSKNNIFSSALKPANLSSRVLKNQKSLTKFNQITTNVQKMLHQFNLNVQNQEDLNKGIHMIEDLQQITRQNIQLKKQYLNKLDQILENAAKQQNYLGINMKSDFNVLRTTPEFRTTTVNGNKQINVQSQKHYEAHSSSKTALQKNNSNSNLQGSKFMSMGQQSKKRKKLFVTQAQPQNQWYLH